LEEACDRSTARRQKSLIQKASKYLAEVCQINKNGKKHWTIFSVSISEGEVNNFRELLNSSESDNFIAHCDDIEILEKFSREILNSITLKSMCNIEDPEVTLCSKLLNKLKRRM